MTARFNRTNDNVSWAAWTWNPVTGCLHQCGYCCARPIALSERMRKHYPHGFDPAFHPERLDAPANTPVPKGSYARLHRVFVCSMADLYGKWVPDEWIERVHASCIANPQWEYLLLTKFPRRYVGATLPETAWVGTSVDEQKRVRLAEDAFRQIGNVRVKWLSLGALCWRRWNSPICRCSIGWSSARRSATPSAATASLRNSSRRSNGSPG